MTNEIVTISNYNNVIICIYRRKHLLSYRPRNSNRGGLLMRAYTRKEYIRKIPGSRIVQYDMGNLSAEFPLKVTSCPKKASTVIT